MQVFIGPATEVNVTAHIITISAVSEVSMDYTLDFYLRQFWHDKRLAFDSLNSDGSRSSLTVGIDMVKSIWVPDTFFPVSGGWFFNLAAKSDDLSVSGLINKFMFRTKRRVFFTKQRRTIR